MRRKKFTATQKSESKEGRVEERDLPGVRGVGGGADFNRIFQGMWEDLEGGLEFPEVGQKRDMGARVGSAQYEGVWGGGG